MFNMVFQPSGVPQMPNIFFDMEFTGLHKNTTQVSISLKSEDDLFSFYAEFSDYDKNQLNDWLKDHVIKNLKYNTIGALIVKEPNNKNVSMKGSKSDIKQALTDWFILVNKYYGTKKVQMITDCGAYDWVLFCDIFGGKEDFPDTVYYIWMDLCTIMWLKGVDPDISREEYSGVVGKDDEKHNAEHDVRVMKICYSRLMNT